MADEVWGDVKHWGLEDHADRSTVSSIDPVCGVQVDEEKAAGKTTHAGVTYYFCSRECQRAFEETPGQYAGTVHRGPVFREVNINAANVEDLRGFFPVDDSVLKQIVENRPYQNWDDFKTKNPGFSDPMLHTIRKAGVVISTPDINRIV